MGTDQFYQMLDLPKKEDLEKLVNNYEFVRISTDKVPEEIKNNGLSKKINSYILTASGSTSGICYSFIGLRPDKGATVIDEHPFLFYYDYNDTSKNFGGILDHGDWPDRTVQLEKWQIDLIKESGLTCEFTYKTIPPQKRGSLYDLQKNEMLLGISKQFSILLKNQQKVFQAFKPSPQNYVAVRRGKK